MNKLMEKKRNSAYAFIRNPVEYILENQINIIQMVRNFP